MVNLCLSLRGEDIPDNNDQKTLNRTKNWPLVITTTVLLLASLCEYWAVLMWDGVANQDKFTTFLAIISAYSLGIAFFSKIKDLGKPIQTLIVELISTNAADYHAANFTYLSAILSTIRIGLNSRKTEYPSPVLYLLSSIALIIMGH